MCCVVTGGGGEFAAAGNRIISLGEGLPPQKMAVGSNLMRLPLAYFAQDPPRGRSACVRVRRMQWR
jgi:hypothetical protein